MVSGAVAADYEVMRYQNPPTVTPYTTPFLLVALAVIVLAPVVYRSIVELFANFGPF